MPISTYQPLVHFLEDTVARSEVATGAAFWVNELPGGPVSSARVRHTLISEDLKRLGKHREVWGKMGKTRGKYEDKHGNTWEEDEHGGKMRKNREQLRKTWGNNGKNGKP